MPIPAAFDVQPILSGERVTLRPVTAEDWEALFALGGEPEVWAGHPARDRYLEPNFRQYFEGGLAGRALVATRTANGEVMGWSRFTDETADPGQIEIGWTFLGRAFWGGGYNAEMKALMVGHAFVHFRRVIFRVGEGNGRSRRAVEKLGAKLAPGGPGPDGYVRYDLDRTDGQYGAP